MGKIFSSKIITIVFFLLVLLEFGYRIASLWNHFLPDFNVFYYSSWGLMHGIDPYHNPFIFTGLGYPIVTLLVYLPLTFFPFSIAQNFFLLFNTALALYCIYYSLKIINKLSINSLIVTTFFVLIAFPTNFTFGMGQSNFLALALLLTSYFLFKQSKRLLSGIFLGLAILVKPLFIFFFFYFLLQKAWKVIFTSIALCTFFTLITVVSFGISSYEYYITKLIPHLFTLSGREIYYNQGFMGFISRITQNLILRQIINELFSLLAIGIIIFLSLVKKINKDHLFAIMLSSLVLIDTLSWQHHFVFLIFPFVYAFLELKPGKKLYFFLIISYILVATNIKNPLDFKAFSQYFILNNNFYGALILLLTLFLNQATKYDKIPQR